MKCFSLLIRNSDENIPLYICIFCVFYSGNLNLPWQQNLHLYIYESFKFFCKYESEIHSLTFGKSWTWGITHLYILRCFCCLVNMFNYAINCHHWEQHINCKDYNIVKIHFTTKSGREIRGNPELKKESNYEEKVFPPNHDGRLISKKRNIRLGNSCDWYLWWSSRVIRSHNYKWCYTWEVNFKE